MKGVDEVVDEAEAVGVAAGEAATPRETSEPSPRSCVRSRID